MKRRLFLKAVRLFRFATKVVKSTGLQRFSFIQRLYHFFFSLLSHDYAIPIEIEEGINIIMQHSEHSFHYLGLFSGGGHEKAVAELFKDIVKEGMRVVDAGAHIGYYTLLAAKRVGKSGKVFAFEPEPYGYSLLSKNIELNQFDNVMLIGKAVSDKEGTARLWLPPCREAASIFAFRDTDESTLVETITLDGFFKDNPSIDVIKMDIEGAEMAALKGAREIIDRNENLKMLLEFHPLGILASGHSPEELLRDLRANGFRLFFIRNNGAIIGFDEPSYIMNLPDKERGSWQVVHLFLEKEQSLLKIRGN
jgi:FkbM family methyltransferase